MVKIRRTFIGIAWFVIAAVPGAPDRVAAQELIEPTRHWAYASFFGTGWYKINDQRSAFILRATPRWTVGDAGLSDDGTREFAYTLRVPLTIGFANLDFEDIPGILDPENYTTAGIGFSLDVDPFPGWKSIPR